MPLVLGSCSLLCAQFSGAESSVLGPWWVDRRPSTALLSAAFLFVRHFLMTIVLQYKLHKCAIFAFVYAKTSALPRLMRLTPATCPPKQKRSKEDDCDCKAPGDLGEIQPFVSLCTSLVARPPFGLYLGQFLAASCFITPTLGFPKAKSSSSSSSCIQWLLLGS